MAYLALYRAFRPTTLSDVVRQEHIVTILKNQILTGKVGHAYLFCGPRGTGKTSIAKIFAQAVNCDSPLSDGSPCGKCERCKALSDPANLDITEIDAASNNGVDEIRSLREKVQYPPVAGKYKVFIIDEVHMLSPGAFNALLKTLEEPPKHAVFILATTEAQKIPATILSRCMRFDFKLIPQADLEARLKYVFDKIGKEYEDEAVSAIARAGNGSVRDMLSLADTCLSYAREKLTYDDVVKVLGGANKEETALLCDGILKGDTNTAISLTENALALGKSAGVLIKDILSYLNQLTVAKCCQGGDKLLSIPKSEYDELYKKSQSVGTHILLKATEIFAKTESELKFSSSPRISLETAIYKACTLQTETDTAGLLARIERIEQKLGNASFVNPVPVLKGDTPKNQPNAETDDAPVKKEASRQLGETEATEPEAPYEAYYDEVPPEAEEGNAYFDDGDLIGKRKPTVKKENEGNEKALFGTFLRALRQKGASGVLYTIAMDLIPEMQGATLVLKAESDTAYSVLTRETHYKLIDSVMKEVGIQSYEIRKKGKGDDELNESVSRLRETFSDLNIEIK